MIKALDVLKEWNKGVIEVEDKDHFFILIINNVENWEKIFEYLILHFGHAEVQKIELEGKLMIDIHPRALELFLGRILLRDLNEND